MFGRRIADSPPVKIFSSLLVFALMAVVAPEPLEARKKKEGVITRPPSKPPVYKKFDNRKKKSTLRIGPKSR
jgi:hypothetical protein